MTDTAAAPAAPADTTTQASTAAPATAADLSIGETPAPAAPSPAPAAPEADAGTVEITYTPTGDVGLDMALSFVGKLGFAPEDAAMKAASNGDFGPLKAKLGALGDKAKGWEGFVALAEKSHKETAAKAQTKLDADTKRVHDAVGGKEQWEAIQKWAGENADPDEKVAVNAALKLGGLPAKVMAEWLAAKYSGATGTRQDPAEVTQPGAAAKPSADGGPLTAAQYQAALAKLAAKVGTSRVDKQPEYHALNARRAAGQRRGI